MSSHLIWFVAAYLVISIAIGLIAALKVHNASDYITAGRHLPIYVVFAAVFATWFPILSAHRCALSSWGSFSHARSTA